MVINNLQSKMECRTGMQNLIFDYLFQPVHCAIRLLQLFLVGLVCSDQQLLCTIKHCQPDTCMGTSERARLLSFLS